MDKIAKLPADKRLQIFQNTSVKKKIPVAMVEKDFWVCWVMYKLFGDKELSEILRFKGGTSLSKAYNLIERFSEDLDIILAKEKVLGKNEDLFKPSIKKQRKFADDILARTAEYVSTTLKGKLSEKLGDMVRIYTDEEYVKINPTYESKKIENSSLHIIYPNESSDQYLRPDILLEIGIMSAWIPNEPREIFPYVAEIYPKLEVAPAIASTVKAHRTFWDKATILHREFYRPENTHTPARYSRHYYDLYQMSCSPIKDIALSKYDLLADVVARKDKLYHCAWARYDLAKPGTLCLLPNNNNRDIMKKDYHAMQGMIFGDIPNWETILSGLQELEDAVNKKR
jgi:hypothetical protein